MSQTIQKPFAGYDDFDACVRDNTGEVDDPDAFCAWLQERAKVLDDPDAQNVLTSLTTEFVSSVDTPAQDSEWLLFKDADTPRRKAREVERPFVFPADDDGLCRPCKQEDDPCEDGWVMVGMKPDPDGSGDEVPNCVPEDEVDDPPDLGSTRAGLPDDFDPDDFDPDDIGMTAKDADVDVTARNDDGEKQIAYAAVLIPNQPDKQGDVIPPYVVEKTAHEYMSEYRKMDSDHDLEDGAGTPVESWILKEETSFETPDGESVTYPAGTWVVGKRFVDDEWNRVQSGELSGFSIYGAGTPIPVDDLVDTVDRRAKAGGDGGNNDERTDMDNDGTHPIQTALQSDTPGVTLAERTVSAKAEMPDDDAEAIVDMLREASNIIESAMSDGDGGDAGESDDEDDEDEVEQSGKNDGGSQSMTDEHDDPETGTDTGDGGDDVADGIDELKSMVKGVDEKVDDFDDRLTTVEDEVEQLKGAVGDDVPNDRIDEGDIDDDAPENDRMKSVEKRVDEIADAIGVDADADNDGGDGGTVARKGMVEQTAGVDTDSEVEDAYDDIDFDDDGDDTGSTTGSTNNANPRLKGGD
jgi:hypothetical protein